MKENRNRGQGKKLALLPVLIVFYVLMIVAGVSYAYIKTNTPSITNLFSTGLRFELIYDANGGTGSVASDVYQAPAGTTSHEFTVKSGEGLAREGYTFLGWSKNVSATTAEYIPGDAEHGSITLGLLDSRTTLHAVWQKDVTVALSYDTNGGSPAIASQSHALATTEDSYTFSVTSSKPGKNGFTFQGWAEADAPTVVAYHENDPITLTRANPTKTLVAVWEENVTVSLSYIVNGGSPELPTETHMLAANESTFTFNVTDTEVTREGYIFKGWADSTTPTVIEYQANDPITLSRDNRSKTLVAVWEEAVEQTFILNFDANAPEGASGYNISKPANQSKTTRSDRWIFTLDGTAADANKDDTGLCFLGWATEPFGEVVYPYDADDPTINVTVGPDTTTLTLYGQWEYEYYVKFNRNVPGETDEPVLVRSTRETISPMTLYNQSGATFERTDYALTGFSLTTSGSATTSVTLLPGLNNATDLYAVWTAGDYALIYDPNGGTGGPAPATRTTANETVTFTISSTKPTTVSGMVATFLGWADTPDATAPQYSNTSTGGLLTSITLTKDNPTKTIYAVWDYTYRVTFSANGGSGSVPATLNYPPTGDSSVCTDKSHTFDIPATPTPTRSGFKFMFWTTNATWDFGDPRYNSAVSDSWARKTITLEAPKTSTTLYAHYRAVGMIYLAYNANGGSGAPGNDGYEVPYESTVPYVGITVSSGEPTRSGYYFMGWAKSQADANNYIVSYHAGDQVPCGIDSATTTIYAVWRAYDTVSYVVDYSTPYNGQTATLRSRSGSQYSGTGITTGSYTLQPGETSHTFDPGEAWYYWSLHDETRYQPAGMGYKPNLVTSEISQSSRLYKDSGTCGGEASYYVITDVGPFTVSTEYVNNPDKYTMEVKTNADGSHDYKLRVYAVWKTMYVYVLRVDGNGYSGRYDSSDVIASYEEVSFASEATSHTFAKDIFAQKTHGTLIDTKYYNNFSWIGSKAQADGYYWAGFSDSPDSHDIVVQRSSTTEYTSTFSSSVTVNQSNSVQDGNTFTRTLYAVFEQGKVFAYSIDGNGHGPDKSDSFALAPSATSRGFTIGTSTSPYSATDTGYFFLGFSHDPNATTADPEYRSSTSLTVREGNPGVTVDSNYYGNGNIRVQATLYAIWKQGNEFDLILMNNYPGNTGSITRTILSQSGESATFSGTSNNGSLNDSIGDLAKSRPGYVLAGYAYDQNATTPDFVVKNGKLQSTITVDGTNTTPVDLSDGGKQYSLTLYAVWELSDIYELTVDANGGTTATFTLTGEEPQDATGHLFDRTKIKVSGKTGFVLLGFDTDPNATEPSIAADATYNYPAATYTLLKEGLTPTQDEDGRNVYSQTLYAIWQKQHVFKLIFSFNGGSAGTTYFNKTAYGLDSDTSYTFDSYASTRMENGSRPKKNGQGLFGFSLSPSADHVDYQFTIATENANSTTYYIYKINQPITIIETPENTEINADGIKTTTLTLYAVWGVDFEYRGTVDAGFTMPASQRIIIPDGGSVTVQIPEVRPTYAAYTFVGWNRATSGGAATPQYGAPGYYTATNSTGSALSSSITLTSTGSYSGGSVILWTQFRQHFTLVYDPGADDVAVDTIPNPDEGYASVGQSAVSWPLQDYQLTRPGFVFLGWADTSGATTPQYSFSGTDGTSQSVMISLVTEPEGSDVTKTIYAVWQQNRSAPAAAPAKSAAPKTEYSYRLIYDNEGLLVTMPDDVLATDGETHVFTISNEIPSREGFAFLGWTSVKGGTAVQYTWDDQDDLPREITVNADPEAEVTELKLYAVWQKLSDDPEPADPEPTNPEPTDPEPTTPEMTNPEPTTPEPTNPEPLQPTEENDPEEPPAPPGDENT